MAVPYTFGSATTSIPLSQLDSNFATTITLGNTAVQLGNTITNLTGVSNVASATSLSLGSNGNTTAITVDTSQNVGIGGTPSYKLQVTATATSDGAYITNSSADGTTLYLNNSSTSGRQFRLISTGSGNGPGAGTLGIFDGTANAYRAVIDSSGRLFVGRTSASAGNGQVGIVSTTAAGGCLDLTLANGGVNYMTNTSGTAAYTAWEFDNNGTSYTTAGKITVSGSATTYATSSDYRLKENVQPMTGALAKVALLKPVTYKWKSDGTDGEGFIAHELAEVCPNAVTGEKDAVKEDNSIMPQGIDTSFLVATLTAAIQELKAINDTQAETINALTARIVALESK